METWNELSLHMPLGIYHFLEDIVFSLSFSSLYKLAVLREFACNLPLRVLDTH